MKNLKWYASNLFLVERNRKWWQSDLSNGVKAGYYPRMAMAYLRMARTKRKEVDYLGRRFVFDNPATPLNLQVYPHEVSYQILRHIPDPSSIATVLDVGGNLGQFSTTLKHFLPRAQVDVLEPNPHVLPFLARNMEGLPGVRVFPVALSPEGGRSLYFEPNRTCTGSMIQENVGQLRNLIKVPVETAADPALVTGRSAYDLVKVDVEGFELDVLSCLAGVSMRYLFLELSTQRRSKRYLHSEMFTLLRDQFGDFDILCQDPCSYRVNNFDVMLEFAPAADSAGRGAGKAASLPGEQPLPSQAASRTATVPSSGSTQTATAGTTP